ncbi:MAG: serine protease [Bacteroidota bacterium]
MQKYTLVCKNCKTKVARTPNQACVKCKIPKWGYTDQELQKIDTVKKAVLYKLICNNCNEEVAKTPNEKCVNCGMPHCGYSTFELANNLVKTDKATTHSANRKSTIVAEKEESNTKYYLLLLAFCLVLGGGFYGLSQINQEEVPTVVEAIEAEEVEAFATADSLPEFARATALIRTSDGKIGTGFLITPTKLLTAAHVVFGQNSVTVEFTKAMPDKKMTAKVKYIGDVENYNDINFFLKDFALLEIRKISNIKPIRLGNSSEVNELDEVLTIGHSQGDPALSFTDGKINSLKFGSNQIDLFKHSIPSNPGNSGGPIIQKSTNSAVAILVGGRAVSVRGNRLNIPQGENIGVKINNVKTNLEHLDLSK